MPRIHTDGCALPPTAPVKNVVDVLKLGDVMEDEKIYLIHVLLRVYRTELMCKKLNKEKMFLIP